MSTAQFYSELPVHPFDPHTLFRNSSEFISLPDDWYVLYTDVEGSTQFWEQNDYATVNKIASSGIEIAIRVGLAHGIQVPYVYGGDGIFACFAPQMLRDISDQMSELYRYAHAVCGANLRVGIIPMSDVIAHGHVLRIRRVGNTGVISHTLFDDSAFAWIDYAVKHESQYSLQSMIDATDQQSVVSYDNYILPVWQRLYSPEPGERFACFIIQPADISVDRLSVYQDLLSSIVDCMPRFFRSHPIITMERQDVFSVDFLKTDGALKLILAGTDDEIDCVVGMLAGRESAGDILFGHVVSDACIMTHLIQESETVYAGLLDIENGGYVMAGHILKGKKQSQN